MEADIRTATPADEDGIVRLMRKQLEEHGIDTVGDRLGEAVRRVLADDSLGCFLVACHSDSVVAIAYLSFIWSMEHAGPCAWLEELYVLPEHRGHGIGRSLVQSVLREARARDCAAVDVEVDASHTRAEHLYRREGFTSLSRSRWVKTLD
jgi:GNAT superfamily N-acetyltransferase